MKKNYFLLLVLMLVFGFATIQAEVLYVKPDASGSEDGASWATATSLQQALDWAQDGDEVYVAKGTYTGSFKASTDITVYGECEGTETTPPAVRSAAGLQTFLKGVQGSGKRVLYIEGCSATFIGFDISGGDASDETIGQGRGGGVYINNGESDKVGAALLYCRIHDNVAMDGADGETTGATFVPRGGQGGGAYIWNGRMENCIVENNVAVINPFVSTQGSKAWSMGIGGGIYLDAVTGNTGIPANAVAANCIIRNNSTTPVEDTGSYTSRGGGIAIRSGILVNSLVTGNSVNGSNNNGNVGGGIACVELEAHVINCTAVKNNVKGIGGGIGFQTQNAGKLEASALNCIAWGNTCRTDNYGEGVANVRYGGPLDGSSALVGKVTIGAIVCPEETVSPLLAITDDPKFTNYDDGDYTLQEGSPAIDAGSDSAVEGYVTDLAGGARITGDAVDIGAYEFGSEPINGIGSINESDGEIIKTVYYTLQGLEVAYPAVSGIYIVKDIYASHKSLAKKAFITVK